jgi:acetylglutamate kinase
LQHPDGYQLDEQLMEDARGLALGAGGSLEVVNDINQGFADADVIYAKSWGAKQFYGKSEQDIVHRWQYRSKWIVDEDKMALTNNGIFMHCLPVRRNVIVTDGVIDSPASAVIDEAENRLHVQKAVLAKLMGKSVVSVSGQWSDRKAKLQLTTGPLTKRKIMTVNNQLRLDLLREALPYIQRFQGQTFVVKLSGKVTENRDNLASLAEELALLHQVGIRICVVHGGGKQLSELAKRLGVEQTIIEGRRVTDDATLEMAKMIFAGKINTDILAALRQRGIEAVGLSGVDGNTVHAERRPPKEILNRETGERAQVDFGHVGDVVQINARLLTVLLDHNYLPVISSLGADDDGMVFNINADTIAAEIAVQLKAEKLILLSDVDGIYLRADEPDTKLSRLTAAEAEELISSGAATGGMIPKLQSITTLLSRGVHSAHFISGTNRNALLSEIFTDKGTGTMLVAS